MISGRHAKFAQSLANSNKPSVSYLARIVSNDNRTLMGRTLTKISRETSVAKAALTSSIVSKELRYFPVPGNQLWRIDILKELLCVKRRFLAIDDFNLTQVSNMIDFLCTT